MAAGTTVQVKSGPQAKSCVWDRASDRFHLLKLIEACCKESLLRFRQARQWGHSLGSANAHSWFPEATWIENVEIVYGAYCLLAVRAVRRICIGIDDSLVSGHGYRVQLLNVEILSER